MGTLRSSTNDVRSSPREEHGSSSTRSDPNRLETLDRGIGGCSRFEPTFARKGESGASNGRRTPPPQPLRHTFNIPSFVEEICVPLRLIWSNYAEEFRGDTWPRDTLFLGKCYSCYGSFSSRLPVFVHMPVQSNQATFLGHVQRPTRFHHWFSVAKVSRFPVAAVLGREALERSTGPRRSVGVISVLTSLELRNNGQPNEPSLEESSIFDGCFRPSIGDGRNVPL